MNQDHQESAPVEYTVTRGTPTDEELAAVVAVLSARIAAARPVEATTAPRSGWAAHWRQVNAPVRPGPGSWQDAVRGW